MISIDTSRYVPDFVIKIDNEELDLFCKEGADVKLYVLSVSITETINQADSFTFTVGAHSKELASFPTGRELACLDDERFNEDHKVDIALGYVDNLALKFLGHITASSCNFPEQGMPTLTVRGFSYYRKLQRQHRRKAFDASTDSGIAREIAADLKLSAEVDETKIKHPLVSTNDETYAAILEGRAARINYEVAVKEEKLIFKQPTYLVDTKPTLPPLTWGHDLRSFQPNLSTHNMPSKVEVLSSQTTWGGDKAPIRGLCTAQDLEPKLGKKSGLVRAKGAGETQVLLEDPLVSSPEEAKVVAEAYCRKKMLEFITARGSTIGNPRLKTRQVVELKGLGERFSGKYYVTSTTHTIDANGYRTDFEVKRDGR